MENKEFLESFDWEAYENGTESQLISKEEQLQKYDATLNATKAHDVVEGTVVSVNKREVTVSVGSKSDGVIAAAEFRYNPDLKPGDKVEVYIESLENQNGQLTLSHKQARAARSWERVNEAMEKDEIVMGYIKCKTKGGMIVEVLGMEAFLPGSQIDVKQIRDYDQYVGKTMEFKVVKINQDVRNVVVSHKALIEAELEAQKKEIMSHLEVGQILEGTVKNITNYGVFIDLGGVDGLIHITDLAWKRINDPHDVVALDQKLQVVILSFDSEKKRIALGLKQLQQHPWDAFDAEVKEGDKIKGKIVEIKDYGAFVEVAPSVEGLLPCSEMSWSRHMRSPHDFVKIGEEVEVLILSLDRAERKMALSLKQLKSDPWETIDEVYAEGSKHEAKVRNFTNFGVFVELEEGVEGLVHISDLSWTKKIKHPSEFTQIGAKMEVVVMGIDKENRRLNLGHKQLEENPWDGLENIFTVGSIVEGTIQEKNDKGAVVALPYGAEGFCNARQLAKEDKSEVKAGDKLNFKITEFNKDAKRIFLSHLQTWEAPKEEEPKAKKASAKKEPVIAQPQMEKTTLGDLDILANLKADMEKAENEK